jgi:lipopolysaccharide export LptBFGC system permease protein LptF
MKKIGLLSLLSLCGIIAFAAFPVETQVLLSEVDPEKFKLDTLGFILGILTLWLMPFYALPLLLLFVKKKNFRGSLAWGWLAGLALIVLIVLIALIVVAGESEFTLLY